MNPLIDIIPASARKYVYAVIALAAFAWSVYESTDGNWKAFIAGLIVAASHSVAAANTNDGPQDS